MLQPAAPRWPTPGDLAKAIDPGTIQTPALELIDQALVDVENGTCDRLLISLPPQNGKSTRVTKAGALWFLLRNPERRVVIVSYGADLAQTFGREIRAMVTTNQGQDDTLDLGIRLAPDNGAVSSWTLEGHRGGVRSIGLTGGITGRPADVLIIDDPLANREQAESATYRERAKSFWTSTGSTRLAPGAPVIVIATRWHEDDLIGWLQTREDGDRWRVINIPAQADHDPLKGETDPLGRKPGEYMESARRNERTGEPLSVAQWEQIKVQSGSRDWNALYQGRPSPESGDILKRDWWPRYQTPMWVERPDGSRFVPLAEAPNAHLIQSWDMTFKDTAGTDFVVGQVWLSDGVTAWLIDQVRDRMSFVQTLRAFVALSAKWPQASLKLVEDKANGPAVISSLARRVGGIVAEEPHGSKTSRVSAVAPFVEAGNVWLPDDLLCPWVGDFVEETAAFPTGAHDDQTDAASQALTRVLLTPVLFEEKVVEMDDLDDELAGYRLITY